MLQINLSDEPAEKIAIIGIGCAFPGGVDSPTSLWKFLCQGRDGIIDVPPDRWNVAAVHDPRPEAAGKSVSRRAAMLADVASFDAAFFGISPREAAVMDPQQRLLLEVTWRALEDAGIPVDSLAGSKTGVYIGISHSDYHGIQQFGRRQIDVHTATGGALSIAANRLSHKFDLHGPSLAIDTACSSSLVALDAAFKALLTGECEIALVGGVSVMLTPDVTITFSRAGMLSPDGRCKAFDARANGYVRGEGAGIVVLKPVSRALLDRDRIHAVICSTAVNQDGYTSTITVPNREAQIDMLRLACARANVRPNSVDYVEAHGTGTPVGDPIEASAIGTVFGESRTSDSPCIIGSIKTNIGHLEPAAGVAGLIKAALCVREGEIPPNLHFESPNPNIDFRKLGIRVPSCRTPWPTTGRRRIAAVNSFGFGGTNACAIVEQPPTPARARTARRQKRSFPALVPISAASKTALAAVCGRAADLFNERRQAFEDIVGTLALRRSHLDHRIVVVARSAEDTVSALRAVAAGQSSNAVTSGRRSDSRRLAFVFTGQGSQWWGMGRGLLQHDPLAKKVIERCDRLFSQRSGWSLIEQMMQPAESSRINETAVAQPATFALQVALAERLAAWGIRPQAVIGHSIGEIAAAHVAGAISLSEAVDVVYHRSRLQERSRLQGAMAVVGLAAEAAHSYLKKWDGNLEVAAINGPELVTIAGPRPLIEQAVADIGRDRANVLCQMLRVDYAFHSWQMDPFTDELRDSLRALQPTFAHIPMFSTVMGKPIQDQELNADYWCRNMRQAVLFKQAIDQAIDEGFDTFVELGAHPSLGAALQACLAARNREGLTVGTLHRERPDIESIALTAASLHTNGIALDWKAVVAPHWTFVDTFGYPWEKQTHWAESEESRTARFGSPVHPLLGYRLGSNEPIWHCEIDTATPEYLNDHRIEGAVVFPAAGYVELMLAVAREILGAEPHEIESISFHEALLLTPDASVLLETSLDETQSIVRVRTRQLGNATEWVLRATGRIRSWPVPDRAIEQWTPKVEPPAQIGQARFYRDLSREGHTFGPSFQGVDTLWYAEGYSLGKIVLPPTVDASDYVLHPAQLDSCLQVIRGFRDFGGSARSGATMAIPVGVDRLSFYRRPTGAVFARAETTEESSSEITADITIFDDTGRLVATIDRFRCLRVARSVQARRDTMAVFYQERWAALSTSLPAQTSHDLTGCWLILADRGGVGEALRRSIAERGGQADLLYDPTPSGQKSENNFDSGTGAAIIDNALAAMGRSPDRIVHLWSLDEPGLPPTADGMMRACRIGVEATCALMRKLANAPVKPRLWAFTAGGVDVNGAAYSDCSVLHAALTGFLRTLANEHPEFRPTLIDLDPQAVSADSLLDEIFARDEDTEIVVRSGQRFGSRLTPLPEASFPPRRRRWSAKTRRPAFRVTMSAPGLIENVRLTAMDPPQPQQGEVLIEVHAVGLNFRDIMAVTGLLPAEAEPLPAWQHLGLECAGVVVAVGEGANADLVGQRVVAMAPGCMASHIVVSSDKVFSIPLGLSFTAAAALPVAFATARYSLVTLGRLLAGERVLIHAATGGVGLAAISIAKAIGAEVLATAGNREKRRYLHKLGVTHVFDSRSLSFADDVLWKTDGRGVDVVLNSLSGPFLEKSLSVLAPGGRFLEIGKRDIYANFPLGLRVMRNNAAFFAIDLAKLAVEQPKLLRTEIEAVLHGFAAEELQPTPVTIFPASQICQAFRHMSEARQIGKLVVSLDDDEVSVHEPPGAGLNIASDATYLVTGGTSGLGLETAHWLVANGARNLVLVGRARVLSEAAETGLHNMRLGGVSVVVANADVGTREGARAALCAAEQTGRPLRGIIHAAGTIDDALITKLDIERIHRVFTGKVLGAWNLHELTQSTPLDFFVMFSSVAATLGSPGQAHYAAANRILDVIAATRRQRGLPAESIAYGPVGDCGYLTRRQDVRSYIEGVGMRLLPVAAALAALGTALRYDPIDVVFAEIDWSKFAHSFASAASTPRIASLVRESAVEEHSDRQTRVSILAVPEGRQHQTASDYLQRKVAAVLKVEPTTIECERPLHEIGLDSLTAFELKNRIEAELSIALPIGKFLQKPTIAAIAAAIVESIRRDTKRVTELVESQVLELDMSVGQEALWFVNRFDPVNPAYGLVACVSFRPHLNLNFIDEIIESLVTRYENLRFAFPTDGIGPIPKLLPPDRYHLARHDTTGMTEATFSALLNAEANRPFDLEQGPLSRLHLFRRNDRDVVLLQFHHIVSDAASIAILLDEVLEGYFALQAGQSLPPSRQRANFGQFVTWQRAVISGLDGEKHRQYWREYLAGAPAKLPLSSNRSRPLNPLGPGASQSFVITGVVVEALKDLARTKDTTLFAVLLASFNALLHRYTGAIDIVVGTPMSGRTRPEFEQTIGYLVNALPIRTRVAREQSFESLISDVDKSVRSALEHQDYPFACIVQDIDPPREPGSFPIFQVMFGMERFGSTDPRGLAATLLNVAGPAITYREYTVESVTIARSRAPFDMTFTIEEFNNQIFGVVDFRSDLWELSAITKLIDNYRTILQQAVATPSRKLCDFALGDKDASPIFGQSLTDLPDILTSLSAAVACGPDAIAVTDNSSDLTYSELWRNAQCLAGMLARRGVGRGAAVGICLPRTRDLPLAMVATLMTGAAFVPLDPSYPEARLAAIIADTQPALIIAGRGAFPSLPDGAPVLTVDTLDDATEGTDPCPAGPSDLAYVIHTSGSTGRPSGVQVERGGLANFLAAMRAELELSPADSLLAITPYSFDIAVLELLFPLTIGARVVVADETTLRDGNLLSQRLSRKDITVMQATPATWQMLIDCNWPGNRGLKALCGGEALPSALATKIVARAGALWNLYGPTETTIWSTCARITEPEKTVPIGRPIANTTCLVVDESLGLLGPGMEGELLIGGPGVARGYLNDPARTSQRFVRDPLDPQGRRKFFRTGDFVRVQADGTLQFLGRRDQQVKVRGFRVELGEIESILRGQESVRDVAVIAIGDDLLDRHLAAFIVTDNSAGTDVETFVAYMRARLPHYMVPDVVRVIDAIPRLPNGKVDRRMLAAEAQAPAMVQDSRRAASPVEGQLNAVLEELLGHDQIGVDDNFFSLGGTSLLGMRYITRINRIYGVNFGAADLIRAPTVSLMAQLVGAKLYGAVTTVPLEHPTGKSQASQKRFWRPLPMARAEGSFDEIDAAAIAYLPDNLLYAARSVGAEALLRRQLPQDDDPQWVAVGGLSLGTIALVVIPRFGIDLVAEGSTAIRAVNAATNLASRLGAKTAALTGLIPAITDYGRALSAPSGFQLTTGHATTASAIVLTILSVAEKTGRNLFDESIAFVGLGAIGSATLRLMFDRGVVPRRLVLCDVPAKHSELKQLAGEVRSVFGYRGKTEIVLSAGTAPPEVYRCGFIIGATNMRGILDVEQLAAGTIVVDDSFPHCFDTELAIRRMASRSDVVLVDGGFVLPRGPIEWIGTLPTALAGQLGNYYETELMPSTSTITGCILSALLSKAHGAPASIGPVSLDISKGHWEVLQRLGIGAAPPRCGPWLVPEAALAGMLDHSLDRRANNVL